MIVHYPHMTGNELYQIYSLQKSTLKLTQDEFAVKVGLKTRSALNNQFQRGNSPVDEDVEKTVKGIPELAQHRLLVVSKQNDVPQQTNDAGSEVVKILTETIQVLKDVLVKGEKQADVMQQAVDSLSDSNKHIREEALMYRRMLADAYDAKLLQWKGKKAS